MISQQPTIGILYPGEMGAAVAALLRARGFRVISVQSGRGENTARRAREAGIEIVPTLSDLAAVANVVVSLVPPKSAESVAADYFSLAHCAPSAPIFVEANSIAPDLVATLAARARENQVDLVDASINGLARNLATSATLYLSGDRAGEVHRLFDGAMRVRVLNGGAGRASGMKMLLGGLTKGVCALYVELALTAHRLDLLEELNLAMGRSYTGIKDLIDRMLPTYAEHAARRAQEMRQAAGMVQAAGLDPCVLAGIQRLHEQIAVAVTESRAADRVSIEAFIDKLNQEAVLESFARSLETAAG